MRIRPTGFELKLAGIILLPFVLFAMVAGALIVQPERNPVVAQAATSPQPTTASAVPAASTSTSALAPAPPPALTAHITGLARAFDGTVGIAVSSVDDGWSASHNGTRPMPQQSVRKLWVAAATLDQVETGVQRLDTPVTLTRADLTLFHQPIRKRIGTGSYESSIAELLHFAMTQSDNAANDVLYRRVGGQAGVSAFLARKKLGQISIGPEEKTLQTTMAGLAWDDRFSFGKAFWQARDRVPVAARAAALNAYLAAPPDGAAPLAIAEALARLARGTLLGPDASAHLLGLMDQSITGPDRLRGGLVAGDGWSLPHKTGTGQVLGAFATAYNDVGLLVAPSGRRYAIVVMIASTRQPVKVRQELMHAVTRAVMACEAQGGCVAPKP